jgi:hypothetical protein
MHFLIQYCQDLKRKDFVVKTEPMSRTKQGQRVYLKDMQTRVLRKRLHGFFESYVDVQRMRIGKKQTIGAFFNEDALLLAKLLRNERDTWNLRFLSMY